MTVRPFSLAGRIGPLAYALAVPLVLVVEYAAVAQCYRWSGAPLVLDAGFWLLPLRRLADLPGLSKTMAAGVFIIGFLVAWTLAVLSFRRATWSQRGHWLSLFAIFPAIRLPVLAILAVLPHWPVRKHDPDRIDLADVLEGVITGIGLIVAAVSRDNQGENARQSR